MEKKQIPIIALAFFSISLLFMLDFIAKPAFAQTDIYAVGSPRSVVELLDGTNDAGCGAISCNSIFIGEEVITGSILIGQEFNQITIPLEKATDGQVLEGNILIGVWNSTAVPTAGNDIFPCGEMLANSVADSMTFYTFNCTSIHNITANQAIGAFYSNTDAIDDGFFLSARANLFDGVNTRATCYANSQTLGPANNSCFNGIGAGQGAQWIDSTADDLLMTLTLTDEFGGLFCQDPANADLLRCRLENQGGALGGNFANNPFDVSQSSSNILIQVGLLDGSDTNPATNGTGFLILAIALIITNALLWLATHGAVFTQSNIFLPALISIVVIGGFTIAGLVDPVMLIISIVALVALSAPKLISIVGGIRGGGSSA